jgi:acyl-CoA reductase-like NAD-dependent aldehyde dehydrogenase
LPDPLFLAELNERLFVHFVAGRWRAPLSSRLLAVRPFDGARMGRLACGDDRDVRRAVAGLRAGQAAGLDQAYEGLRPRLAALRALEGFDDLAGALQPAELPGQGPLVLLTAGAEPVARLAGLLIAAAPRGVLWKPAPAAAASAHLLIAALGPRAAGGIALVQGDHATGAALRAAGLPILSPSARSPHRPE